MLPVVEKLLILQERDRQISRTREELSRVVPERDAINARMGTVTATLEAAKLRARQLEAERHRLEVDVDGRKEQINKYLNQQNLTKKNEEYQALTHQIETSRKAIHQLEDQQLEIMEKAEVAARDIAAASQVFNDMRKTLDGQLADLAAREKNLTAELASLEAGRAPLAEVIEDSVRSRYERLLKNRGHTVVVGIAHSSCGGCHMRLQRAIVLGCQAAQEVTQCPNCGRILFFTPDMDLAGGD